MLLINKTTRTLITGALCSLAAFPAHAWKMESGRLDLSSTSGVTALQGHVFQQVYDTPPIVVALPTTAGGDASALRITNVTTTGFQMSPVEPFSEDGPHASMNVAYIAIEPGVHTLPNGEIIEAGQIITDAEQYNGNPNGRKDWADITFSNTFANPVVLADIQTTNNEQAAIPDAPSTPWLTTALQAITNTGAEVALERSELYDRITGSNFRFDDLATSETIGYIAMDGGITGNFRANGNQLVLFESLAANNAVDGWSQGCDGIAFAGSYSSAPIVVATKSSHNEDDGGWLRECNVSATQVLLTIDEDDAQDSERAHVNEDVSAIVFSNTFTYDSEATGAETADFLMLEADRVDLLPDRFTTVTFQQVYDAPPAVFLLENDNNPEPTSVRIRNISETGFEVVPVEPDSRVADATDQSTQIHYLAVTPGEFTFPDGTRIEVGPLFPPSEIANYQSKRLSGDAWYSLNYANNFSSVPAFLSQIQTMNNEGAHTPGSPSQPWMTTAVRNVTASGAQIALDRAETNTGTISAAEGFAYLAVEPGLIGNYQSVDGTTVASEAQRTADNITGTRTCISTSFLQSYTGNPLVIGSQMTWDGGDGGWLRRCSASTSQVSLKIEEDWALDTDNNHTTERVGFMAFDDSFYTDFSLVANYQLEGPTWTGAANEVIDGSDSALNGQRMGDALPRPAQVCNGALLDGDGDYIEVPDNAVFDLEEEMTVMAWVNIDAFPASDLKTIVSKDGNYEFHVDSSGRVFWWWNSSGGTRSLTSTTSLNAGQWHHVAISYSLSNGEQKIYIDGVERASDNYAGETLVTNSLPFFIGTDYNFRSRDFNGSIDEVKVFKRALPAAAVQRYASDTRECASCILGSFEITQAAYGLACPDTPAAFDVVAKCIDGSTKEDYTGTVDLSSLSGSAFFADAAASSAITSLTYNFTDSGAQTAYLYYDDENTNVAVTANDSAAGVSSTATTGTDFRAFGFRVSQQPGDFSCGDNTTLTLQAYGQTDSGAGGACEVIEGFSGIKSIDTWFTATLDDNTTAENVTTPLRLNTTDIVAQTASADGNLSLNFSNGEANVTVAYGNTARILGINFRHNDAPYDDSEFGALTASADPFVASPATFSLIAQAGTTDLDGTSASASTTHAAGANFDLAISAECSDGAIANDYQPNAATNALMAYVQRTGPTGGSSVDGDFRLAASRIITSNTAATPTWVSSNLAPGAFTGGSYKYSGAYYSEVGHVRLHVKDEDYFGIETGTGELGIGRFIPAEFDVSISNGALAPFCSPATGTAFTYSGQAFDYATLPSATITARNALSPPQTTRNYTQGAYQKLIPSDVARIFPTSDATRTGADTATLLPLTSSAIVPAAFAGASDGVINYVFDSSDSFTYTKVDNARIAPFNSDVRVTIGSIRDADAVSANMSSYVVAPAATQIRYGRWAMDNAFGPETSPLAMPMRIEIYDGSRFVTNTSDECTTFTTTAMTATPALSGGTTTLSGGGTLSGGLAQTSDQISLSAPGAGNIGEVALQYNGDAWLRFDWDNDPGTADTDATATALFGQYRGHDRIIYWREVAN